MYEQIIEDFKLHFPLITEEAVQYSINRKYYELTVRLKNGRKLLFDGFNYTIRTLPDLNDLSDYDVKIEFGKRLRKIMERKHIMQSDLSEMTGIPQPQISKYVNGEVNISFCIADKIARALSCSMDDFRCL